MNWRPNPKAWSIAQNIDHLIRINESYFSQLEELHLGSFKAPFIGKLGFLVSFFGKSILKSVEPSNTKKISTFPIWQPSNSKIDGGILERFKAHQEKLKLEIKKSTDMIAQNAIISSPANKWIVYRLETAFDIIVLHEKRHLKQSEALLHQLVTQGENTSR